MEEWKFAQLNRPQQSVSHVYLMVRISQASLLQTQILGLKL